MNQNERKPTPIGQEGPKTPADRVRLIQEMQRAAEAAPMQQQAPVQHTQAPAQAVMETADIQARLHALDDVLARQSERMPTASVAYVLGYADERSLAPLGEGWIPPPEPRDARVFTDGHAGGFKQFDASKMTFHGTRMANWQDAGV